MKLFFYFVFFQSLCRCVDMTESLILPIFITRVIGYSCINVKSSYATTAELVFVCLFAYFIVCDNLQVLASLSLHIPRLWPRCRLHPCGPSSSS